MSKQAVKGDENKLVCYIDGGCSGNPGKGGWGAYINFFNTNCGIFLCGYEPETTNNKMEITAAINLLQYLPQHSSVIIYTDSQYLKNGITDWIIKWEKNNWMTSAKKPVKNLYLWKQLLELSKHHTVSWNWVKSHSNNLGNDIANDLAVQSYKVRKLF